MSGVAVVAGSPVVLAAVHVPVLEAQAPVLVLANPLDTAVIRALSDRTNQAIMLSDAAGSTAIAGPAEQRVMIQTLTGREASPFVIDPHGHWVAAVVTLGPGVRVWTLQKVVLEGLVTLQSPSLIPWAAGTAAAGHRAHPAAQPPPVRRRSRAPRCTRTRRSASARRRSRIAGSRARC